ncbi:MAG: hypothetical protein ACK5HP_03100 [Bacilli bacterium]
MFIHSEANGYRGKINKTDYFRRKFDELNSIDFQNMTRDEISLILQNFLKENGQMKWKTHKIK